MCVQAWRTYHQYHSEFVCAEGKLREAEKQEERQKQSAAKKLERLIEKVDETKLLKHVCVFVVVVYFHTDVSILQRQGKCQEIQLKCSKARNDYLLNLAAANSSMNKYFLQDISALIDVRSTSLNASSTCTSNSRCLSLCLLPQCADVGYHFLLGKVVQAYLSRRLRAQQNLSSGLQQLQEAVSGLDQSRDRDTLMQENYNTFAMPLRFPYQPHEGDQVCV